MTDAERLPDVSPDNRLPDKSPKVLEEIQLPPIERGKPKRHEAVHLALDGVKWRVNEYHGSFTRTS